MRLYTSIILIFVMYLNVFGQQKHYFVEGARWVYETKESYEPGQLYIYSNLEEITIKGDTIMDGIEYKKMYTKYIHNKTSMPPHQSTTSTYYETKGSEYIRFDESLGKLFFKENTDSTEVIVYDINLKVGDTLSFHNNYNTKLFDVKRIDTLKIFGKPTKHFVLDTSGLPLRNAVIEGIGGINGLTYHQPIFPALGGGIMMTGLVCFEYKDSTFLGVEATFNQRKCPSTSEFTVGTKDFKKELISIYPNPSFGSIIISIPEEFKGSSLNIYNQLGSFMYTSMINQSKHELTINDAGLYFYNITNESGKKVSGKIVIIR